MYNIVMVCQYGASTDLVANRMRQYAEKNNIDIVVNAYPESSLDSYIDEADVVLLAPQIRFRRKSLEERYQSKGVKFLDINTRYYGMLDGEHIIEDVLKVLNCK